MGYSSGDIYKYDTITDTYTKMLSGANIFWENDYPTYSFVSVGTNIYFSAYGSMYVYDTILNTITSLNSNDGYVTKRIDRASGVAIGSNIYWCGGYNGNNIMSAVYVFNTVDYTWTNLTSMSEAAQNFPIGYANDRLYIFGDVTDVYVFNYKNYSDNSIVLWQGAGKYKTQMYSSELVEGRIISPFVNVWHYTTEGGLDASIPTYYGDGTQWIKFKN